jgi:hypothetical protein
VQSDDALELETHALVEADWLAYLRKKTQELGARAFRCVVVVVCAPALK